MSHSQLGSASRHGQSAAGHGWGSRDIQPYRYRTLNFLVAEHFLNFSAATLIHTATMKITNSAVPVYTISGSEARPLPEWLIRRRKRCAKYMKLAL